MLSKKIVVIGAGFAGLSAACFLAKAGHSVTLLEKNDSAGGRARTFTANGFTFDMGPSWYWMPEVFERFFGQFGRTVSDHYSLIRLDPSYEVIWKDESVSIPASFADLQALFEKYEPGAGVRLQAFLEEAEYKYRIGVGKLVYKPGLSFKEFLDKDIMSGLFRLDVFTSVHRHLRKYFRHPKLLQLAEFPILFLGALPRNTPALYSLMNYADIRGGTWYPMGGMGMIATGMEQLARSLGVTIHYNQPVRQIVCDDGIATAVRLNRGEIACDAIVSACDYHHTESVLLPPAMRSYTKKYWSSRSMAPSCLLFYLGLDARVPHLVHHNLFFDASFEDHAEALYSKPEWPVEPLMYVCCPSKTDASVAPVGRENLFVLIPVAPGLKESATTRRDYLAIAIRRIQKRTGMDIGPHILFQRSYAGTDFVRDYNSFRGNAYGLANTLRQTAVLKPAMRSRKVENLFFAGQLTVPGPGVPPAIISGEVAADQLNRFLSGQTLAQPI